MFPLPIEEFLNGRGDLFGMNAEILHDPPEVQRKQRFCILLGLLLFKIFVSNPCFL